ncbi:MAG: hypothetical protein E7497_01135 [Ruminococcus sp.]|nr:hypothetical protein [Ruminococcus sp.]
MESEKIRKLKEQYTDKKVTKAQRQAVLTEVHKERYKADKRKPITLYNYHKVRFWGFFLCFMMYLFEIIRSVTGLEDNKAVTVFMLIFSIIAIAFISFWCVKAITRKIEIEDELARENLNKARVTISFILVFAMLMVRAVVIIIDDFMNLNFSITIESGNISNIAMLILWGYFALESGLFLIHEGKTISDDDIEED